MEEDKQEQHYEELAIIGMAGRFPGARNIDQFWGNLCNGVESVGPFSDDELKSSGVNEAMLQDPSFVNSGAVMEDADKFDASFFGIGKREAEIMDPQHRVFLECAWEVLENAGYNPESFPGIIGIFGGVAPNSYFQENLITRPDLLRIVGHYPTMIGNEREYAISRVAFKLNFKGPAISVNTACSSSLVAVHLACQSLLSGESDMALAGGARIKVPLKAGYIHEEGGILSSDGHCCTFDAKASGTVIGNGAAIVLLKRLSEAVSEGDTIYAVIKGTAVNNDGSQKIGFTAPSVPAQKALILDALAMAGVEPDEIGYIEAHGTGTHIGDPIEFSALDQAFREGTKRKNFCGIGSVKTNIGHLDAGAGVAGVIKTALSLRNGIIPPSLNFTVPNPQIDLNNSPFYVNTELKEWPVDFQIKRAGVSSFGLGGTNAHIILEEPPQAEKSTPGRSCKLLLFSAKSENALDKATSNFLDYLNNKPEVNLGDVSYTLQVGRSVFSHCRIAVCCGVGEAINILEERDSKHVVDIVRQPMERDVVFMFSGQGSQYINMALGIYEDEPFFREQVDLCSEILKKHISLDIREILFPPKNGFDKAEKQLEQTAVTQPALFTIEYALAQLWISWGVLPKALVGHSVGEYTAACIAGVFNLEDCLELVAARGQLMQDMPGGSMLAVFLSEDELEPLLPNNVAIAAINGPSMCAVSGGTDDIENFHQILKEKEINARPLHTSHAFHSEMMEPIVGPFKEKVAHIRLAPPAIPVLSNATGTWLTPDEAMSPEYWAQHLRQTVRFAACIDELSRESKRVFLEVGPGQALTSLVKQNLDGDGFMIALPSTRHPKEIKPDLPFLLTALGQLHFSGVAVDWKRFHRNEKRSRISLPTYPFEHKRFWVEPMVNESEAESFTMGGYASPHENPSVDEFLSVNRDDSGSNRMTLEGRTEQMVADIWQNLLGAKTINADDNFFELGGDSLVAVGLFRQIEKKFNVRLPLATLYEAPTFGQMVDILQNREREALWSSLVEIKPGGSRPPLFLVHAAGGNVLLYRDLVNRLSPDQPVYGLQAKGLDGLQPFNTTIEEMAADYLKEIKAVQPTGGPYLLGGYCMGGTVAFEIAQQLRAEGQEVAFLALIETYNFSNVTSRSAFDNIYFYIQKLEFHFRNFLLLKNSDKAVFFKEKLIVLKGRMKVWFGTLTMRTDKIFSKTHGEPATLSMIWKINEDAAIKYRPKKYDGTITHFRPVREYSKHSGSEMGWKNLAPGRVANHKLPVYPAGMLVVPFVDRLADEVAQCIEDALSVDE